MQLTPDELNELLGEGADHLLGDIHGFGLDRDTLLRGLRWCVEEYAQRTAKQACVDEGQVRLAAEEDAQHELNRGRPAADSIAATPRKDVDLERWGWVVDDACEEMELAGWHREPAYRAIKELHAEIESLTAPPSASELLHCPFCASAEHGNGKVGVYPDEDGWVAGCTDGCRIAFYRATRDAAVTAWNTRAGAATAQLRRLLEDLLNQIGLAVDDWSNLNAPDYCDSARVAEARERVFREGSAYYIARTCEAVRRAKMLLRNIIPLPEIDNPEWLGTAREIYEGTRYWPATSGMGESRLLQLRDHVGDLFEPRPSDAHGQVQRATNNHPNPAIRAALGHLVDLLRANADRAGSVLIFHDAGGFRCEAIDGAVLAQPGNAQDLLALYSEGGEHEQHQPARRPR